MYNLSPKTCFYCHRDFQPKGPKQVRCPACQVLKKPVESKAPFYDYKPKFCLDCQKEFKPASGNQARCVICQRIKKDADTILKDGEKISNFKKRQGYTINPDLSDISWG